MSKRKDIVAKMPKEEFKKQEQALHTALLTVQRELRDSNIPVIVIISGVEGAGKGGVVNRLNEWLDTRGLQTFAYWDESEEDRERPRYWRFWRDLPPRGTVGIMFGSWYTQPIIDRAFRRIDATQLEGELQRVNNFEQMLVNDGALIVKFWFHISAKEQAKQLRKDIAQGAKSLSTSLVGRFSKRYEKFHGISEQAIRVTNATDRPWHFIESSDKRARDLEVGEILLDALRNRLTDENKKAGLETATPPPVESKPHLNKVKLGLSLEPKVYERELTRWQQRLRGLAWKAYKEKRHTIAVFEGWDAAGKGGAIRRVTAAMDARLFRVISVAAPTDEEKARHYLWRFWRHVPRAGYATIYDRSWYGRVLVERVEKFADDDDWRRAYREINEFEAELADHGVILLKFWVHISPEEQLRRFREREKTPWKHHKITDEDWRNRKQWNAYRAAVDDMFEQTSTANAPWTVVPGNDKRFARIHVLKTFCRTLEKAL